MFKRVFNLLVVLIFIAGCGTDSKESIEESREVKNQTSMDTTENTEETTVEQESISSEDSTTIEESEGNQTTASTNVIEPDEDSAESTGNEGIENEGTAQTKTPPRNNDGKLTTTTTTLSKEERFVPTIDYTVKGNNTVLHFKVKNQMDNMFTFHFDSSQRYEYIVKDDDGNVVSQYSKSKKFTSLAGEEPVKPGGSLDYEVTINDLPKGKYHVMFVLTAKEMQPKTSISFIVK
ncbi:BsuPI-related putative proteinase inhibitor [Salirhabdus sp. Marseille-P4669]|uniref:BsuPI-related putative proteinase inhibitor n=1 Tax=Salirhabdus sp. Marseille-P4669 TaxID=2042310 RepID=UPI0013579DD8|nr:BsuPI-related putative proteinase inhibitor [Salirhabdus sp. Marseille-P4669]